MSTLSIKKHSHLLRLVAILALFVVSLSYLIYETFSIQIVRKSGIGQEQTKKYLILTPVTEKSSVILLKEVHHVDNRIFVCSNSTESELCQLRLKGDYTYETLPGMMNEMFSIAYEKYPEVDFFFKSDDDTIIQASYLNELSTDVLTNYNGSVYFGAGMGCPKLDGVPCRHGPFYGMSRDLLKCAFMDNYVDSSSIYTTFEDCHTCYRVFNYCPSENITILDSQRDRYHHKYLKDNQIEINFEKDLNH
ncbi:hypothetical protein K501DRAFT_336001 [Backusella circina FSU 941]|nr:hypothetical protein K501DRAFT_336001 [Backusella circina FSU 941]